MRRLCQTIVIACSLLGASACGDKKEKTPSDNAPAVCKSNEDCKAPLVCLAGECADPRVYKGGSNMVTPDKVKKEVEDIGKRADERNQKALDL